MSGDVRCPAGLEILARDMIVFAAGAGIPFNFTVTGCISGNGYNSFEAIFWRDQESGQGRPFLLDTTYGSDTEGLRTCMAGLRGGLTNAVCRSPVIWGEISNHLWNRCSGQACPA